MWRICEPGLDNYIEETRNKIDVELERLHNEVSGLCVPVEVDWLHKIDMQIYGCVYYKLACTEIYEDEFAGLMVVFEEQIPEGYLPEETEGHEPVRFETTLERTYDMMGIGYVAFHAQLLRVLRSKETKLKPGEMTRKQRGTFAYKLTCMHDEHHIDVVRLANKFAVEKGINHKWFDLSSPGHLHRSVEAFDKSVDKCDKTEVLDNIIRRGGKFVISDGQVQATSTREMIDFIIGKGFIDHICENGEGVYDPEDIHKVKGLKEKVCSED